LEQLSPQSLTQSARAKTGDRDVIKIKIKMAAG